MGVRVSGVRKRSGLGCTRNTVLTAHTYAYGALCTWCVGPTPHALSRLRAATGRMGTVVRTADDTARRSVSPDHPSQTSAQKRCGDEACRSHSPVRNSHSKMPSPHQSTPLSWGSPSTTSGAAGGGRAIRGRDVAQQCAGGCVPLRALAFRRHNRHGTYPNTRASRKTSWLCRRAAPAPSTVQSP